MDELFWYIKKKENTKTRENTYIILLINTNPRQILGYYAGKYRTAEVKQKIADEAPRAKVYCTDGNFTYKNAIFPGIIYRTTTTKARRTTWKVSMRI